MALSAKRHLLGPLGQNGVGTLATIQPKIRGNFSGKHFSGPPASIRAYYKEKDLPQEHCFSLGLFSNTSSPAPKCSRKWRVAPPKMLKDLGSMHTRAPLFSKIRSFGRTDGQNS